MLNLTINGLPAVLKAGTSFTLITTNNYFEQQGDYSFEVVLPLEGCGENQRIFGPIHRADVSLMSYAQKKFPMILSAPPLYIRGYAQIRHVTQKEVKVQLVAGTSAFLHSIDDKEVYVDKLDLGHAWDSCPEWGDGEEWYHPGWSLEEMMTMFEFYAYRQNVKDMIYGAIDVTDSVCFPIWSQPDDFLVNPFHVPGGEGPQPPAPYDHYHLQKKTLGLPIKDSDVHPYTVLAPQPYLLDVVRRIIVAAGYKVGNIQDWDRSWIRNIFIANSRSSIRRAEAMPHWTLQELVKELQNFLGLVVTVSGDIVSIYSRKNWYVGKKPFPLHLVVDEFDNSVNDDTTQMSSSAGNVEYDWPVGNDMISLPDEVYEYSVRKEFGNKAALDAFVATMKEEDKKKSEYLMTTLDDGHSYAFLRSHTDDTFVLTRVNQFGKLVRNPHKRDADITLRIVPSETVMQRQRGASPSDPGVLQQGPVSGLPTLVSGDTILSQKETYSIDDAVNPKEQNAEEYATEGKEVMEVAYCGNDALMTGFEVPVAVGCFCVIDWNTGLPARPTKVDFQDPEFPFDGPFSLLTSEPYTIADRLTDGAVVDMRVEHCFEFLDNDFLDPKVPYLIKGKRYACHKIEYTIDENGVRPLKRGYFYEIR